MLNWIKKKMAEPTVLELSRALSAAEIERDHYKQYAGSQILQSDFQNADQMREALVAQTYLTNRLKEVVVQSMTNSGWALSEATEYIETTFSINKAIELLKVLNENQANNDTPNGS